MFEPRYEYGARRDSTATSTADWDKIPVGRGESVDRKEGVVDGRFELAQADIGDVIVVRTAQTINEHSYSPEVREYSYTITVVSAGLEPLVDIEMTGPDGNVVTNAEPAILRGAGEWTTYRNNPMVRGADPKISARYGHLFEGGQMMFAESGTTDGSFWLINSKITSIDHLPFLVDQEAV